MRARLRRLGLVPAILALLLAVPAGASATAPDTTDTYPAVIEFPAGAICPDAMLFEDLVLKAHNSLFAPAPDGSQRFLMRGSGVSRLTDLDTGRTYDFQGGVRIGMRFDADGSARADATGSNVLAWYFPGDPSVIGAGIFRVIGHVTEWYGADGSFLGNAVEGSVVNLCEALAR